MDLDDWNWEEDEEYNIEEDEPTGGPGWLIVAIVASFILIVFAGIGIGLTIRWVAHY